MRALLCSTCLQCAGSVLTPALLFLSYLANNSLCGTIPVGLMQPNDGALPACSSCSSSLPGNQSTPPRLDTSAGSRYFHQPLVNCLSFTASNTSSFYPSGFTLSAADCAARCDAIPSCVGFKYPWLMSTQPANNTAPALTNGQVWNWCIPLDAVNISTCTALLRPDTAANNTQFRPHDVWEMYWRGSSRQWPAASTWTTFYNWWGNQTSESPSSPNPPGCVIRQPNATLLADLQTQIQAQAQALAALSATVAALAAALQ